jgi:hypothetical protein
MQPPWRDLKETEMLVLRQRQRGRFLPGSVSRLRKLVMKCGDDPDAEAAICYHGSLALLFEFDRDWPKALKHRRVEIRKIRRLHKLAEQNCSDAPALQGYQDEDLRQRLEILEQVQSKSITEPDAPPNRRAARPRPVRAARRRGGR